MRLVATVIVVSTILVQSAWLSAQSPPNAHVASSPIDLLEQFNEAKFPKHPTPLIFEQFVRFGNLATADRWRRGNQFDRIEIEKGLEPHQKNISKSEYVLKNLPIYVQSRNDFRDKGLYVECSIGCRIAVNPKDEGFSNSLRGIQPNWCDRNPQQWFLTKERTLRGPLSPPEAEAVRKFNGFLYNPEGKSTQLVMVLNIDFDLAKKIAASPKQYTMDVVLGEIQFKKAARWGYFLRDTLIERDFDTEQIIRDHDNNTGAGVDDAPSYFPIDAKSLPWLVTATLHSASLKSAQNEEIAAYRRPKSDLPMTIIDPKTGGPHSTSTPLPESKQSVGPSKGTRPEEMTNRIGMKLVSIPSGKFTMGSPKGEKERMANERQHTVEITQGFWMGKYEVTQDEFEKVMEYNRSRFKGAKLPVEQVSWHEAKVFCRKLSEKEGKEYCLPTEAEWEYACRAGTKGPFSTGENLTTDQGNYNGELPYSAYPKGAYLEKTLPVGSFLANGFGLHDMHGNVSEWCEDWYGEYQEGPSRDPKGPLTGSTRVIRGGGWSYFAGLCRSAHRGDVASIRLPDLGFRVVLRAAK